MTNLLSTILSDDQLKRMSEPAFAVLPDKKVKKGDNWKRGPVKLEMGPIGTYNATYEYTYAGPEKKDAAELQRIDVKTSLDYKAPEAKGGQLPFVIKEGALKTTESKGQILFDEKTGRVVESTITVGLSGNLKIEVSGTVSDVTLTQSQVTKTSTSDKNPREAAKP
jgi:hypothetical protein